MMQRICTQPPGGSTLYLYTQGKILQVPLLGNCGLWGMKDILLPYLEKLSGVSTWVGMQNKSIWIMWQEFQTSEKTLLLFQILLTH